MLQVMDRLLEARTAIDNLIRRQRKALATVGALENMKRLELARQHVRQATSALTLFEPAALTTPAPGATLETPTSPPGE